MQPPPRYSCARKLDWMVGWKANHGQPSLQLTVRQASENRPGTKRKFHIPTNDFQAFRGYVSFRECVSIVGFHVVSKHEIQNQKNQGKKNSATKNPWTLFSKETWILYALRKRNKTGLSPRDSYQIDEEILSAPPWAPWSSCPWPPCPSSFSITYLTSVKIQWFFFLKAKKESKKIKQAWLGFLVGGFKPSEKYSSKWESSPSSGNTTTT